MTEIKSAATRPQTGPQSQFLASSADIAIYGGAAGGGKSWALLVEPLRHSHIKDFNAVFFRRSTVQIKNVGGLWDESHLIYTDLGAIPKENPSMKWIFPSGATVVFSHLEHDKTVLGWQGSQICLLCCTASTPILMDDGTHKNVGELLIGDIVKTHQGGRRVTHLSPPVRKKCVTATVYDSSGFEIGKQTHSRNHKIMTPDGWVCYDDMLDSASESIQHSFAYRFSKQLTGKLLFFWRHLHSCIGRFEPIQLLSLLFQGRRCLQVNGVCTGQQDQGKDFGLFQSKPPKHELLPSIRLSVVLHVPVSHKEVRHIFPFVLFRSESSYARFGSLIVDWTIRYLRGFRLCGERFRWLSGFYPNYVQQQVDVEQQSPSLSCLDGEANTLLHSRIGLLYRHPYTGGEHFSKLDCEIGSCVMVPVDDDDVIHFTVEGENHYISGTGLVNKNCFDELCHFSEKQFWYMLSRNRSMCGVKPYVRATCNPDADSWVKEFIQWWLNPETGLAIPERSGVIRWMVRTGDSILWADRPDELAQYTMTNEEGQEVPVPPKSVTFIHSALTDNKILMRENPEYMANLLALPTVERERLLGGNWNIRPAAGLFFNRNWVEIVDELPVKGIQWVRGWDLAATIKTETNNPDWTCGTLVGRGRDGTFYVADHVFDRLSPNGVERLIKNVAGRDGRGVRISIPQDPAQSGKSQALGFTKMLAGYRIITSRESGPKETRFSGFSAQAEGGNVIVKRGKWNSRWFRELEGFPEGKHDDDVDSTSRAFNELLEGSNYSIRGMI